MHPRWFTSPQWLHALTLAERRATLLDRLGDGAPRLSSDMRTRGQQRLERRRTQAPFAIDAYFAQRLAADGLDLDQLVTLLGEPLDHLAARLSQTPAWLETLTDAFSRAASEPETLSAGDWGPDDLAQDDLADDLADDPADPPTQDADDETAALGFLELVQPLVAQACERLQAGLAALLDVAYRRGDRPLPFDPDTIEDILLDNLIDPLLMRLSRTLVLEMHVARLQGLLDGDTPEARFDSFVERLRRPEDALALLAEYPVLARQLVVCLEQWTTVSLEFLTRLCADWETIRATFSPQEEPGELVELTGGAGDTHRGGRSVMIARFESGFQIVYKPKSMAVDVHFQHLLAWLNQCGCQPPLHILTILDRGDYGWVEFIARQGCRTRAEVGRFYQRHGAYLALLYVLNANDFHFENLIAAGEQPVLIDLETILQPEFEVIDDTRAELAADKVIINSVMQISLLPLRLWSSEDYAGIDISGLGGASGQLSPDRLPQLTGSGTDAMRVERRRIELERGSHRPMLGDEEVSAAGFVEDVIAGFTHMVGLLMAHRAQLTADDGPLRRFAHDEIRVLLRPTRTYDQLLTESFHPDMLRDGLEREHFLDRLWVAVPDRAYLGRVVQSELADLQQGDIPIFTTHPSTLALYGTSGQGIEGVLVETGMDVVHRRLQEMGEPDLRRQIWFIRASFATLAPEPEGADAPRLLLPEAAAPLDRARLLAGVRAVADRVADAAIHGVDDVSWVGLGWLDNQGWTIRTVGIDLYGGIPGIALFLAYAGAVLDEERYTRLARRAVNTLHWQTDLLAAEMAANGGFYGWGGVLYTLTHLAALWDDGDLLAQAAAVVEIIADHIAQDDVFDIARGSAGGICALLGFHRHTASDDALRVAALCGDHLLATARPQGQGWELPAYGEQPLVGLAHGQAGIAWALLQLADATGDERYRTTAQQVIEHQRSLDAPQPETPPDPASAVQIALARLCLSQSQNDPQYPAAWAAQPDALPSHALFDGAMGCLDLWMQAGRHMPTQEPQGQANALAARLLAGIEQGGLHCGTPQAVEVPGLMLGLSGIGYQLLRLAEPDRLPSPLILAPPPPVPQPVRPAG